MQQTFEKSKEKKRLIYKQSQTVWFLCFNVLWNGNLKNLKMFRYRASRYVSDLKEENSLWYEWYLSDDNEK